MSVTVPGWEQVSDEMKAALAKGKEMAGGDAVNVDSSVETVRNNYLRDRIYWNEIKPSLPVVEDFAVPGPAGGIPVRLYKPADEPGLPVLLFMLSVFAVLVAAVSEMKLSPAAASGGAAYLRALSAPVPAARFCPTGGVTLASAPDYLALPNVGCVGGSWLTPQDALLSGDWARIATLAAEAAVLG